MLIALPSIHSMTGQGPVGMKKATRGRLNGYLDEDFRGRAVPA